MKTKVLTDLEIVCDPPRSILWGSLEHQEKQLEWWVKEFHEFIRDHRSQDPINLEVRRIYEEQCEFCHRFWEVDDEGCPVCCDEAVKEWEKQNETLSLQES